MDGTTWCAGIVVPEGFDERADDAKYPVVVDVPGFGGTHRGAARMGRMVDRVYDGDLLWVVPDPSCYRGHSVFADSATNGPWGAMLVEEMLPKIDAEFGGAGPEHRYATGVSSGGWSSLWLQVHYIDDFAGCWSHVPDPVDFRDFQYINLYKPGENMYVDADGNERGLARRNGEIMLTYREFVAREEVLGPGGQIHSFEAVFSPRLVDGEPMPIFDRETGAVDVLATELWKPYDIRLKLERAWKVRNEDLAGKIRVYAGEVDTFYLEGAVRMLANMAEREGIDATIEVIDGMGHSLYRGGMMDMLQTIKERWEARGVIGARGCRSRSESKRGSVRCGPALAGEPPVAPVRDERWVCSMLGTLSSRSALLFQALDASGCGYDPAPCPHC
ncbi:MAG: alpha/beta hydrolase-fold protein [Phycisphaerales bacterium]